MGEEVEREAPSGTEEHMPIVARTPDAEMELIARTDKERRKRKKTKRMRRTKDEGRVRNLTTAFISR